ncbi:hypothetical protein [Streptomyces sp. CRN 30]|uniref:hypothetical protein n=1 Tax=Streptomyces sp. CRN 30 TaxID=3075613 RepID=UPI002A815B8C|nr:hypothetical protein [Streptomyces sp. CRN 30]
MAVSLDRDPKSADEENELPASASLAAYEHWTTMRDGEYGWNIADTPVPKGDPKETTSRDRAAAENTVVYTTSDILDPRVRESRLLYYKAGNGDLYTLWVGYPGQGHFTGGGRENASTIIANLEIDEP